MIINLDEYELNFIILSLNYTRRYLHSEEGEYKNIAIKMIRDSYDIENKLIKYIDSLKEGKK